jgi:RNase P/RNase MRP subunit p29
MMREPWYGKMAPQHILERAFKRSLVGQQTSVVGCGDPRHIGKSGRVVKDGAFKVRIHTGTEMISISKKRLLLKVSIDGCPFLCRMDDLPELKKRFTGQAKSVNFFVGV